MNDLNDNSIAAQSVVMISADSISPSPYQPRKVFSESSLKALSESISENGIIEPLLVRKTENGYELIAGERRLRASRLAGLPNVPCIVRNDNEKTSSELALIENLQRENLNMFEEAAALCMLLKSKNVTQESLSKTLSCSQSYIANKIRLLKLDREAIPMILENNLTERHARALLKLPKNKQPTALRHIIENSLNVAETERYTETLISAPPSAETQPPKLSKRDKALCVKQKMLKKDLRLFYNSLDKLLDSIRECGIDAECRKTASEDVTKIEIFIKP